uniref:DUF1573 domain-containing protein n=1 Tax=Flavobacterium sp. TaxID=239 RepID=UPI0040497A34
MKTNKFTFLGWVGVLLFSATAFAQAPRVQASQKKAENVATEALKPATEVKWEETTHNFGDIKKGVPVNNDFTFVNTTSETIIITNVKASCGCTATNYTKTPIKPGETGFVSAKYNAANSGAFSKTVRVNFNEGEKPVTLVIKGKVVEGESR